MWTNVFPFFIWRRDLIAARNHFARSRLAAAAPKGCAFANAFDGAYAALTNAAPAWGYEHRRNGFSQFNLLANFVLHRHPAGYTFHVVKSKPGTLVALRQLHPQAAFLAADAATRDPSAASVEGGYLLPAMNAAHEQGVAPIMRRVCCALHPSLHRLDGCKALEAAATAADAKAAKDTKEVNEARAALAVMDGTFGSVGKCYQRPAGDACARAYEEATRQHLAEAPAAERARAEGACQRLVEKLAPPLTRGQAAAARRGQRQTLALGRVDDEAPGADGNGAEDEEEAASDLAGSTGLAVVGLLVGTVAIAHRATAAVKATDKAR
jgi:hypothetical protein